MKIEGLEDIAGADLIQDTFLFSLLDFDETLKLARLTKRETYKKGDTIIHEGALGQALYLVEKGKVKVYKGEGKEREELAQLGKGELFGEMSLVEDELTSASVVAETDVSLLVIKREEFQELLESEPVLALKVYKAFCHTLSERLRKTSEELAELKRKLALLSPGMSKSGEKAGKKKSRGASRTGKRKQSAKKRSRVRKAEKK